MCKHAYYVPLYVSKAGCATKTLCRCVFCGQTFYYYNLQEMPMYGNNSKREG